MSLDKARTDSGTPQYVVNASESSPDQQSGVAQWIGGVCVGDMIGSDVKISRDPSVGDSGKPGSTSGASSAKSEAVWAGRGVGGVHSSEDQVPDLWSGENTWERRDATCSAGEKRKEGRGDGSQGLPAPDKVRQLQISLYRKAKSKPGYRFWSLYGEVQRLDVLTMAWKRVAGNGGAAGIDGERIEDIQAEAGRESQWLEKLRVELRERTYRPSPVLRVTIPKASGGTRPLGIPTVKDRVVQMAVYLVLMPIWEADFHPSSHGFRPQRSAHGAVEAIRQGLRMGKTTVVDADLSKYFDTIPHRRLMKEVAKRVSDGSILSLIKGWLRAPVLETDEETGARRLKANRSGTPQGGVLSPLLANIYLNPLDHEVNERCREKPRMIRYADDLVILCRAREGASMKARLARWLEARGLSLNESKSRVVQSEETPFDFLGFTFSWRPSKKGTRYVHAEPSAASRQRLRDRLRAMTRRETTWRSSGEVVREMNQVTRGWGNYFALGNYHRKFGSMNWFAANRLRQWLWRKHGNPCGKYLRWPQARLQEQYGLYKLPTHLVERKSER